MSLGTIFQELATNEITNGELWTHEVTLTYGPRQTRAQVYTESTDGTPIAEVTGLRVAAFPEDAPIDDTGTIHRMWKMYIPAAALTVAPNEEDAITIDGVRQDVLQAPPLGANGVNAVYIVYTRR